jgi:tripartite ATP-independent transporter DctM subunit
MSVRDSDTAGRVEVAQQSEPEPHGRARRPRQLVSWLLIYLPPVVLAVLLFVVPDRRQVGVLLVVLVLLLIALRVPVGAAMTVPAVLGMLALGDFNVAAGALRNVPYDAATRWTLSVIPMFVFMGVMLWRSGSTDRLYGAAREWLGWLPGGTASTTNVAGAILGAVSGSSIAVTHALARIGVPEMLRQGYDKRLATGSVVMAGTGDALIPPSLAMVIYAGIAGTAVGPQLLAGTGPGIILHTCYAVTIAVICLKWPRLAGGRNRYRTTPRALARTFARALPFPLLIAAVIGGLYTGLFTATEVGAVGALGAMVMGLVYLRSWRRWFAAVRDSMLETVLATATIFFMLIGALLLSRVLVMSGIVNEVVTWIIDADLSRIELLLVLTVAFLLLGCIMDGLTTMLLAVPLMMPVIEASGISPIWFGVFVVLLVQIGTVHPPIGILGYVVHSVVQDKAVRGDTEISLKDIFTGVVWFLPSALVAIVLLIAFPGMTEWFS